MFPDNKLHCGFLAQMLRGRPNISQRSKPLVRFPGLLKLKELQSEGWEQTPSGLWLGPTPSRPWNPAFRPPLGAHWVSALVKPHSAGTIRAVRVVKMTTGSTDDTGQHTFALPIPGYIWGADSKNGVSFAQSQTDGIASLVNSSSSFLEWTTVHAYTMASSRGSCLTIH